MVTSHKRGFSLRTFVPDGSPDGLRIVEKSLWTGTGVVCPRALFASAKVRPEFQRTGVYILLGPAEESGLPLLYVGEGDPVRPRLEQHAAKKDFWTPPSSSPARTPTSTKPTSNTSKRACSS